MSRPGGQPIRVLHVDDEPDLADLVATYLERSHDAITVRTATSARDGLDRLEEEPVDCIVSDHDMPKMDGLEFLRVVRESHPDLPFLLFTGKGSEEIASDAISAGVTEYLQKEAGTEQYTLLANRIERAVEEYRAKSALEESERMLSTLISNIPGMAYRCLNERGWPMEFVSEGCCDLTGYDPQMLVDGDVNWGEDILVRDEREDLWKTVQQAIEDREPFEVSYRITTADGEVKWVWEQGRAVYDGDDLVAIEGIIMDISDRKADQTALDAVGRRHETLVETIPMPVVVLDADESRVVEANTPAASLFEATRTALLDRPASALFSEPTALLDGAAEDHTRIETMADDHRSVEVTTTRVRTDSGSFVQVILEWSGRSSLGGPGRFESVIDRMDDAFVAVDTDQSITYVNDRAESLLNRTASELLGTDISAMVPEEITPEFEARMEEAMAEGSSVRFEIHYEPSDRWFDVSLYPAADGLSIYARDMTHRRERETELERYRTLVENVGDSMYVLDTEANIIMANQAMADHLGYEREELVGSHASRFMPDEDVETGSRVIRKLLTSEQIWGAFEMETIHADGSRSLNEDKVAVLTDGDGEYVGSVGVIRDISERKQRERELQRYETIIQAVGDPVYALDKDGYFTFVNDAAHSLAGYEPCSLIGEHVTTVISQADYERSIDHVMSLLESDDRSFETFEIELLTSDGESIPAENHLALRYGEDGVRGTAGVIRDISERKRRENRLEEFASVVSHDLQSPLNVIAGRAELALETGDMEHVQAIQNAADRMDTLIDDLLTLAHEGQTVGETRQTTLSRISGNAWEQVQTPAATLSVTDDLTLEADPERLRELLANFFRNAVEHAGPEVTVSVGPLADGDGFYVADDGQGIPNERRQRVFEHGHTTSEEGTGLGLAIVETIAEAHGWSVRATESEDDGARFEVVIE